MLKIILGCLIAIGIAAIAAVAAFVLYVRKAINSSLSDATPLAIHLHEDLAPDWLDANTATDLISDFAELGFSIGKPYNTEELPQVQLCSLFHPRYCGVIYNIDGIGYFYDIVHRQPAGDITVVTNSPYSEVFDTPPGTRKFYLQDSTPKDGFGLIEVHCDSLDSTAFGNDNFREITEQYYKMEQAHRNRNGGISFDEFQRVSGLGGKKISQQHLQQRFVEYKTDELETWSDAGVEDFVEANNWSDEQRYGDGWLFLVPEKTDPQAFVHFLARIDLVDEDDADSVAETFRDQRDIIELFEQINLSRSADRRATKKADVDFPVAGRIYQLAA